MPFALVFIGLLLIVSGARDTYQQFGSQVVQDMTGSGGSNPLAQTSSWLTGLGVPSGILSALGIGGGGFIYWIIAVIIIGAIGYYEPMKGVSRLFLLLIVIGFIVANGGVFQQFTAALQQGPIQATPATPPAPTSIPLTETTGSSSTGIVGSVVKMVTGG
jgi:hypothetical protein